MQLPVPQAVARLHRNAFEPNAAEEKLGGVVRLVTHHDAALQRGELHTLVLFAGGAARTWRPTRAGAEEPFQAKLLPEEQARASQLLEAVPRERAMARVTFDFDHARIPDELGHLVGMLKQRLELTNRR